MNLMRGKQEMVLFSPAPTLHHVISPLHSWLLNNRGSNLGYKNKSHFQILKNPIPIQIYFPGGTEVKNLPATGSTPGSERSPGEGNGNPLQYSCLGNPMHRGAWRATVCGAAELETTEWLNNNNTPNRDLKASSPPTSSHQLRLTHGSGAFSFPVSLPLLFCLLLGLLESGQEERETEEKWQSLSLSWLSLKTFVPSVVTEDMALVWGANVWILWGFLKNPWNSQASIAGDALPATGFSITYPLIFLCGCLSSTRRPFHFKGSIRVGGAHFSSPVSNWPWKTLCFPGLPVPSAHTATPCFLFCPCPCGWLQPSPHLQTPPAKCGSVSSQLGQEPRSTLVEAPQSFLAPISWSLGGGGAQNLALSQQVNNSSSVMTFSALSLFQPSLYKDHGWVMAVRDERPVWQPLS